MLAGLDIAESRRPQDGRFDDTIARQKVDFRVSTLPVTNGESLVMRLLLQQQETRSLDSLGFHSEHLISLQRMLEKPEGLILVSGPTGSGKTTTLYALLRSLQKHALNIVTLEDPVEYRLQGIRQSSVNKVPEFDFAAGVRAALRQDPDVILLGEIRDSESAAMALRAAMTGHRVLATVHAGSVAGIFSRLQTLGLSNAMLSGHIIGAIAQRLVRRLCPDCATHNAEENTYLPAGCPVCHQRGYQGRLALADVILFDPQWDQLLQQGAHSSAFFRTGC